MDKLKAKMFKMQEKHKNSMKIIMTDLMNESRDADKAKATFNTAEHKVFKEEEYATAYLENIQNVSATLFEIKVVFVDVSYELKRGVFQFLL